jgi:hypothetical protein
VACETGGVGIRSGRKGRGKRGRREQYMLKLSSWKSRV